MTSPFDRGALASAERQLLRDGRFANARVERVRAALARGEAVIAFDPLSEQCALMLKQDVPQEWLAAE